MKVTLLNAASPKFYHVTVDDDGNFVPANAEFEHLGHQAASLCVGKLDKPTKKGMMTALESGHLSIIEHLPISWLVEDISRACSHQLVRHRLASYSQQSQRYAKVETMSNWYVFPKSLEDKPYTQYFYNGTHQTSIEEQYKLLMDDIAVLYNEMIKQGVPNEDARYILPNACFTSLIVSMNARSLIETSEKRLCNRAQWEIKELFTQMKECIKNIYPTVYNMCKPPCETNKGCTEVNPCHKGTFLFPSTDEV